MNLQSTVSRGFVQVMLLCSKDDTCHWFDALEDPERLDQ